MKKFNLIIIGLLLTSGAIFFSCTKEIDNHNSTNNTTNTSKPNNLKNGIENPFEWVGVYHNEALDYFIQNASPKILKSGNDEAIINEIKEELLRYDNIANSIGIYIPLNESKENVMNNMFEGVDFEKLDFENAITACAQEEQPYLNELNRIMSDQLIDTETFILNSDEIVFAVNNSSTLTEEQKAIILLTIAVGKNSVILAKST